MDAETSMPPHVADYIFLRRIGGGAYGDVWMAKTVTGQLRAIKIIQRERFADARPYDREFSGIQKYETISRRHPGLLDVLHVGKGDSYFYYVMPLADSLTGKTNAIAIDRYQPRTLSSILAEGQPLPVNDCVAIAKRLLQGLQVLHRAKLVHRDIKPSNVVFVHGEPVLADLGLVTTRGSDVSAIGTPGFVPLEGPGNPRADLYAMGMLLYCMSTGHACSDFPSIPSIQDPKEQQIFGRLNSVILRACSNDANRRYSSALAMHDALEKIAIPATKQKAKKSSKQKKTAKARTPEVSIQSKGDFKSLIRDVVEQNVARCRVGYSHDQQFLTAAELRRVTGAVRQCFRNVLGRLPDEISNSCKLAEAVLEPSALKRRDLLEYSFGIRGGMAGSDGANNGSTWLAQTVQSVSGAVSEGIGAISDHTSVLWNVASFGLLQRDPDKATSRALEILTECVEQAIDDNWPDYRDEMGIEVQSSPTSGRRNAKTRTSSRKKAAGKK